VYNMSVPQTCHKEKVDACDFASTSLKNRHLSSSPAHISMLTCFRDARTAGMVRRSLPGHSTSSAHTNVHDRVLLVTEALVFILPGPMNTVKAPFTSTESPSESGSPTHRTAAHFNSLLFTLKKRLAHPSTSAVTPFPDAPRPTSFSRHRVSSVRQTSISAASSAALGGPRRRSPDDRHFDCCQCAQ